MADLTIAVVFGLIGYVARKTGYNVAAILIGVILGPLLERSFLLSMRISGGDWTVFFSSAIANILWALLAVTLLASPSISLLRRMRRKGDIY